MERHTRSYLQLIKPGITLSNTLSAAAGFMLASSLFGFSVPQFIGAVVGVALVIASACVINNIIDRKRDVAMKRTKKREIAAGNISVSYAIIYAVLLGTGGFTALAVLTNGLTVLLGIVAYVWYVGIYGVAKRTTPFSTLVGTVSGALPPVAGYTAISGRIDVVAVVLFGLWATWQMAHFYAISIFREQDYRNASLPVWSVRYGLESTRRQILIWLFAFLMLVPLLSVVKATGAVFTAVMSGISFYWLLQATYFYKKESPEKWAKRIFGVSLVVVLVLSAAVATGGYLP